MKTIILAKLDIQFSCALIDMNKCMSEKDYSFHFTKILQPIQDNAYKEHPFQTSFKNGVEELPHITALFGFKNREDYFKCLDITKEFEKFSVKIGKFKVFRNDDKPYDVLVLSVDSPELISLNSKFEKIGNIENKFEYHPHLTVAYINKGTCVELEDQECPMTGKDYLVRELTFSTPQEDKLPLPLKLEKRDTTAELSDFVDSLKKS